ncbi:MAG: hypothetical protein NDI69_16860 [Bacteriovoracaceae bacterium]|nr:hypothetical protein [Bacteriovoracaceae bacterium]
MKKWTGFFLALILISSQVSAESFKSPDIIIDSKLDYNWSGVLISKFRQMLKNNKMNDPFVGKIVEPILVNESTIGEYLPASSKAFMESFGNAVGLQMIKSETKVWMHGLSYDVKGFKTNLKAGQAMADGLVMGTEFSASEVSLEADKISLTLVIPGKNPNASPIFKVDILRPVIRASEENLINFFTQIKIQDNKDFFKLQIQKANFDKMAKGLLSRPQDIHLDFERIIIPEVSLKVGNKTVNFSPAKIEQLIRDNQSAIKGMILAQAAHVLKSNTTEAAFRVLEQVKINKEHWINTDTIQSQIMISRFSTTSSGDNIEINLPGDFCTSQKFNQLKKQCVHSKVTKTSDTRLTTKLHNESVFVMKDLMDRGEANIVASISEDYLNKLLVATYDAGLWKAALDEAGVELGPNKVTMRMDKRGESGTLIMDVIYKPSKMEKIITGSKQIRFPLVLEVAVRIEKIDDEPVVIVRLNDVDTSDETLIYGRPEENLISTVQDIPRFKNKVANTIREKLTALSQKDLIELRYPELRGLGLDKVDFLSDGNGRMNAIMRLEDLLVEN